MGSQRVGTRLSDLTFHHLLGVPSSIHTSLQPCEALTAVAVPISQIRKGRVESEPKSPLLSCSKVFRELTEHKGTDSCFMNPKEENYEKKEMFNG